MRRWFALLGLITAGAQAQPDWFTVTGNPDDASVDTVQVDPVAVKSSGDLKTMNVRVSRSAPRINWDGVPYCSYASRVVFDCRAGKASYLYARYYLEPLWQGASHKAVDYAGQPRPMLFRNIEPNPTGRIVRAACRPSA
ncbi:hypothetical protein J7E62_13135 [Variovorax paradoxus]|nr:hypothetical protein [Variovorax paradoxus]